MKPFIYCSVVLILVLMLAVPVQTQSQERDAVVSGRPSLHVNNDWSNVKMDSRNLTDITVLIVYADDGDAEPLRSILEAYPNIDNVDIWLARGDDGSIPLLSDLEPYDVVVTWSNYTYADRNAMGDVLADYVDGGGSVVQSVFNWIDDNNWGLGGRFVSEGYSPFVNINGGNHFNFADLGSYNAGHPLMDGVTAASDSYRDIVDLHSDAILVASWDDDEEFVAYKGNVVAINAYSGIYYQWTGDVGHIFYNAVTFLVLTPEIAVSPESFDVAVEPGGIIYRNLTISNVGEGVLDFSLSSAVVNPAGYPIHGRPGKFNPLSAIAGQSHKYSEAAPVGPASVRSPEGRAAMTTGGDGLAWTGAQSMPDGDGVVRYAHAQCAEDLSSFYVISGVNQAFSITDKVWRYNTVTDQWTELMSIPTGREGISATCYNGYIYAVGGGGSNQFYIYEIASNEWASGPALPRDVWGAAVGAHEGYLYMVGGDNNFSFGGTSNQVNIYDIGAGNWIGTGMTMPSAAVSAGFAQAENYLYVVGGWGDASPGQNVDQTQRYDMSSNTWDTGPTFSSARGDLPLAITMSHLYAIGGDANGGGAFDATSVVEKLDHTIWPGGSWEATTSLPGPLTAHKGGFCTVEFTGGEVWSVGGYSGSVVTTNQYEPAEGCFGYGVPWLSMDPTSGSVGQAEEITIVITFDATDLEEDTYHAEIIVSSNDPDNPVVTIPVTLTVDASVGVNDPDVPVVYNLQQNYPNPFNPSTTIRYGLPERSVVKLEIYNTLGQRVSVLVDDTQEAGFYEVTFDASQLSTGVYLYRLQAGEFTETKKLLLLK